MNLYRQSNTYFFMLIEEFLYNGKLIEGMAISLKYKIYKIKDNTEFLFKSNDEELSEQSIGANGIYIHSYVKCYFDEEKVINIVVDEKGLEEIGFRVEYEIDGYFKLIKNELFQISKKLFYKIIKEGIELFDISGNKPAQVIGYTAHRI